MKQNTEPNVKFWWPTNGSYSKITLRPGEELHHHTSERTEEGWHSETACFEYDLAAGVVDVAIYRADLDCDGRFTSDHHAHCPIDRLAAEEIWLHGGGIEEHNGETVMKPDWTPGESSQRDYSAESMGY